ncbi:rubredoxin [Enterocloster citroniae]|uniref:rubredoxin n=1 Tax=Enterocloster citroniae TaxID=358743 RepID=UPI003F5CFC4F
MKKFVCGICGFIYDEAAGIPASGIAPGTRWEELHGGWVCPWCGAAKEMFREQVLPEAGEAGEKSSGPDKAEQAGEKLSGPDKAEQAGEKSSGTDKAGPSGEEEDLRELTPGEMSALCSNLARGCEKQYLKEEALLFTRLAGYFKDKTLADGGGDVKALKAMTEYDLDTAFPSADQAAGGETDRGALRALVWSRKVTAMMDSLLARYEREGSGFLEHTNVYVCDICGFIYVGDTPPDICPVCKVPSWKMSKVERRSQA